MYFLRFRSFSMYISFCKTLTQRSLKQPVGLTLALPRPPIFSKLPNAETKHTHWLKDTGKDFCMQVYSMCTLFSKKHQLFDYGQI